MRLIDADAVKETFRAKCGLASLIVRMWDEIDKLPTIEAEPVVRCKDCRHFSVKDHWGNINGVPILGASDVPTCDAWANTECMVDPDGYCFLGERKEGIEEDAGKA